MSEEGKNDKNNQSEISVKAFIKLVMNYLELQTKIAEQSISDYDKWTNDSLCECEGMCDCNQFHEFDFSEKKEEEFPNGFDEEWS